MWSESGSLDRTGAPLVFNGVDSAVVAPVTMAINEIVEGVPLRVTIAQDDPSDAVDATQFISYLETNTTAMGCSGLHDRRHRHGRSPRTHTPLSHQGLCVLGCRPRHEHHG